MSVKGKVKTGDQPGQEVGQVMDYGDDAGRGFENQTVEDLGTPFIYLIQTNSPEVDKDDPKFIKGAKVGDFFNSITKTVYKGEEGITFIPCSTKHEYVEWIPRTKGGGFVAVHDMASTVVAQAKKESKEYGKYFVGENNLVETFYVYAVVYHELTPGELVLIPFTSTKIKAYKDHNSRVRSLLKEDKHGVKKNPPIFANRCRMTSFKTENEKGKFCKVDVQAAVDVDLDKSLLNPGIPEHLSLLSCGKNALSLVESGEVKVDYSKQAQDTGGEAEDTPTGAAAF